MMPFSVSELSALRGSIHWVAGSELGDRIFEG